MTFCLSVVHMSLMSGADGHDMMIMITMIFLQCFYFASHYFFPDRFEKAEQKKCHAMPLSPHSWYFSNVMQTNTWHHHVKILYLVIDCVHFTVTLHNCYIYYYQKSICTKGLKALLVFCNPLMYVYRRFIITSLKHFFYRECTRFFNKMSGAHNITCALSDHE